MINRTDLAVEAVMTDESEIEGVETQQYMRENLVITKTKIDESASEKIGKSAGEYVTVFSKDLFSGVNTPKYQEILTDLLKEFLPKDELVLIVGLGNREITPDALGPLVAGKILATRHLSEEMPDLLPSLRAVASLTTGVLAQTGIETAEIIKAVCEKIKPKAVVVIDALAARDVERLLTTIQFSNTGIEPGAGVLNKRAEISKKTLNIPVIALGVPTVVDAYKMSSETESPASLMVTPKDIDVCLKRAAELISLSLNCALQLDLSCEEIAFLSM